MDELEKIIIRNRDHIQNDEPAPGHFERFEMKLTNRQRKRPNYWIGFISGVAAVLLIGIIFFVPNNNNRPEKITLAEVSEQYANVEFYYTRTIKEQTNKLYGYSKHLNGDSTNFNMMIRELEEYDQMYNQLCTELGTAPNDERVINAMLVYYQTKLEIINRIINEIENKQLKTNSNENISI
ncbi:MAG: hypothetical protein K9H26_10220 [Prolixibacteraceae bacterium]|nr:hypothetical protein [Prolixibacteraceae bacterium]